MLRPDHQPSHYSQHGVLFDLDGRPQLPPGRYLRKRDTGQVFAYSEILARRGDMEEVAVA